MTDHLHDYVSLASLLTCPWCEAEPGKPCREWERPIKHLHPDRIGEAGRIEREYIAPLLARSGLPILEREWGTRDDWYDEAEVQSYGTPSECADGEQYARLDAERMGLTLVSRLVGPWRVEQTNRDEGTSHD